jgi:uncharacterized protein YidB (DUF937 family)
MSDVSSRHYCESAVQRVDERRSNDTELIIEKEQKMGLLDSVVGALGGQEQNSVVTQVMALINNPNCGGLAGLLQQFKAGGLGHVADSWVGTGQNLPISAEQLQCVLGSEQVQQMAAEVGISPDMLSGQLAKLLPQAVDKITPDGNIPDQGALQQKLGGLLGMLGGR